MKKKDRNGLYFELFFRSVFGGKPLSKKERKEFNRGLGARRKRFTPKKHKGLV